MEESIKDNLTSDIWDVLGLKSVSPRQLSPLVLAYIGDSIFDLVVKTKIVTAGNTQVNKMNRAASSIVKAESQSKMIGYLEDKLTEEEGSVYMPKAMLKKFRIGSTQKIMLKCPPISLFRLIGGHFFAFFCKNCQNCSNIYG